VHPLQPDEVKALKAYLRTRNTDAPALFLSNRNTPIHRSMLALQEHASENLR
jgi:integrase